MVLNEIAIQVTDCICFPSLSHRQTRNVIKATNPELVLQVKYLLLEVQALERKTHRYFLGNNRVLGKFIQSKCTLPNASVFSEHGHQFSLILVDACLPDQYYKHAVRDYTFANYDLTAIVDFLFELFADVGHSQPVVLFEEGHFNLQVHAEVELLFFGLVAKLFSHNQAHAIRVCLLQALKLNLVKMVLFVHVFSPHSILVHIFFTWLVKEGFNFHFPSHISLESLIHSRGL